VLLVEKRGKAFSNGIKYRKEFAWDADKLMSITDTVKGGKVNFGNVSDVLLLNLVVTKSFIINNSIKTKTKNQGGLRLTFFVLKALKCFYRSKTAQHVSDVLLS